MVTIGLLEELMMLSMSGNLATYVFTFLLELENAWVSKPLKL